ncbi:hypothetical protein KIN20_000522 [Parelaphostrongylus tenuis]|uniref:Uncharacterized protein n=1 Tax=Parelaphostrongylus tenuis TaxID=148309 RepID=A0AAD5MBE5_PARTN|nr:hypothetical protein KIN20_000522 [Parelaphostrongylus tenuis]
MLLEPATFFPMEGREEWDNRDLHAANYSRRRGGEAVLTLKSESGGEVEHTK